MNDWARTSEQAPRIAASGFNRRVYQREFEALLGVGTSWFRMLEKRGAIPAGSVDPGGKRKWWTADVVGATLDRLNTPAERTAV